MSAGNRKNMYRPNTEYADNLRRQQKHKENMGFLLFLVILAITGIVIGALAF